MRIAGMAALLMAAPASAQGLNAEQADAIVKGCAAHARAKGHAIAVVDLGGHPVAMWRMDGNAFGMMDFSLEKARAVAAWGFPTSGMEEAVKGTPGFADAPHVVPVPGGIPVFSADGRTRLGGVGASGEAPADDAACAAAGIAAAGLKSERAR
ncbi:GlcG/HbpS family heme-binding protein [Sphingopyxis sp. MSC1_008]|jgi:glc operon protein GlcG|uniref:GlcG/HbpS family heme-binding protein n=1 Tax=Sphingopyxis sp. MSC1_008 TaxID=2909265 RepID=UPI0020BE2412|nr:heme-binding protein [Sphingopyxis sp. MSC1_008]